MGYKFKVENAVHIKYSVKEYPWPCESNPKRTIEISESDVLTKEDDGYMKHTGLGCFGIQIPDEDVVSFNKIVGIEII